LIEQFSPLREISFITVSARMILAFVCGGLIGIEREFKRRPAGFRTHILICLGAAVTTLTSQYLFLVMRYYTDMTRLGAQVIAGIGFIGAGTIIVTNRKHVKGLTTAAGLWAAAIVGLAIGAGFYEGGLLATVLILFAELVFSKVEYRLSVNTPEINLFIEYTGVDVLNRMLDLYHEKSITVSNMTVTHSVENESANACVIFSLRLPKGCKASELLNMLPEISGVVTVEEL